MGQRLRQERGAQEQVEVSSLRRGRISRGCGRRRARHLALILHTAPPPAIHTAAAAPRLRRELEKGQTEAARSTQGMVQADETELNSFLKEYLRVNTSKASADAAVRDLKVNLSEDRLRLYLLANIHGKDLTFVLEGKVRSADGYLDSSR